MPSRSPAAASSRSPAKSAAASLSKGPASQVPIVSPDHGADRGILTEATDSGRTGRTSVKYAGVGTGISENYVKVHFRLEVDEDGWPPASVESLWAVDLGDGTVRLDNTPWFVRGVASGDIIRVDADHDRCRVGADRPPLVCHSLSRDCCPPIRRSST
ncbi:DUF4265 domain-containing protein [Streptomyces bauhiniae]|uniref:DUF4265 domain-containing protein n=1 Tax=Streptomyces bauhiniae TaxID=2340725 RepID=UPI00363FC1FE